MTRERRNAARPRPADAANPSASVICPRYAWPTLWSDLVDAGCNLWTGPAQPSPNPACSHAAPVEVLVTRRGLEVARRHDLMPQQEAYEEPADRLDAAIAREIERIRARQQGRNP